MSVAEITSRTVKVRWKPSFAGNNAIVGFILEYRAQCFESNLQKRNLKHSDEVWKDFFINDPNIQTFLLRDLYPWCAYELQMKAKNSIGVSEASQLASFRTAEEMPGGPPLEVSVEPLSSNSLKIKWKPPDKHLQYGLLKGYYVGYRLVDGSRFPAVAENAESLQLEYKKIEATGPAESNAFEVTYLTNLKKHSVYSIVISAFNKAGAGPRSDEVRPTES